jgi:hypothetical protein
MPDRDGRDRGHSYDTGHAGGQEPAKARSPEAAATERVFRLQQEAASAATAAQELSTIVPREEWRARKAALTKRHAVKQLQDREVDAKVSERAQGYHDAATEQLGTVATALKEAKEPRPVPPVSGGADGLLRFRDPGQRATSLDAAGGQVASCRNSCRWRRYRNARMFWRTLAMDHTEIRASDQGVE